MTRVGLLHTVPPLAEVFDRMLADSASEAERIHVVDASLLGRAVERGVDGEVERDVARYLRQLLDDGAAAILVTCSSIGEAADRAATGLPVPVIRIDRPMAEAAVGIAAGGAGRILVLATLVATVEPTTRLMDEVARRSATTIDVESVVVDGAADARARGDLARHDELVAEAVRSGIGRGADVVVLAQASMAPAADAAAGPIPVLTSPAGGVAALVASVRAAGS